MRNKGNIVDLLLKILLQYQEIRHKTKALPELLHFQNRRAWPDEYGDWPEQQIYQQVAFK